MNSSLWRSVRMVAWSFLGIRKGSASQEDLARINPIHVVGAGIAGAAIFVVGLILFVNWVAAQ